MHKLGDSLWCREVDEEKRTRAEMQAHFRWNDAVMDQKVMELRKTQSEHAGVSVAYLLSDEFLELAQKRTGNGNPSFIDMRQPFWLEEDAIGKDAICPRDLKAGVALMDTLPQVHRPACTHFLSWVWSYPILQVREALQLWVDQKVLNPQETFLFMCFFVNNQFRMFKEQSQTGSDNLEEIFERNLIRIGQVVALLDHWADPIYLSRVWCIFEQFTAVKLQLPITMILPREPAKQLVDAIGRGNTGIFEIKRSLCKVDAEKSKASFEADEIKVKYQISSTTGFQLVNDSVKTSMVSWVATVVQDHMNLLVSQHDTTDLS